MKVCGAPGEIRTPDPLVRSLKKCFFLQLERKMGLFVINELLNHRHRDIVAFITTEQHKAPPNPANLPQPHGYSDRLE
jgi:hypothetical protein